MPENATSYLYDKLKWLTRAVIYQQLYKKLSIDEFIYAREKYKASDEEERTLLYLLIYHNKEYDKRQGICLKNHKL